VAGAVCFLAIQLKFRFGYDDALDVIGVHLVGGIVGSLMVGLFADKAINPLGADGLFYGGGASLLGYQAVAVLATLVWSGVISFVLAKVISATIGLRCSDDEEIAGLDLSQHAETAYAFGELGSMGRTG
jgi:Amt family ammonium transporter